MIVFECPSCKKKLQANDQHAGKAIRCPHCQAVAKVPAAAVEEAPMGVMEAPPPMAPPAPPPPPVEPTAIASPEDAESTSSRQDRDDEEGDDKGSKRRRKRDQDDDEDEDDDRPRKRRRDREPAKGGMGVGMVLLILCVVGFCCAGPILVALLVPAVQKVREAAARTQSINNLKQIGLGFHAYHDVNKMLPFNGTGTQAANPGDLTSGSWGYQILPFLEQAPAFQLVNRNAGVPAYMCPGRGRPPVEVGGGAWTDYFYNNYLNGGENPSQPNAPNSKRTLIGITDGTSNTIMVGHGNINTSQYMLSANVALSTNVFDGGKLGTMRATNNAGKVNPNGWTLMRDSSANPTVGSWGGPFPQGALMCMGDGTVRMFPYHTQSFGGFLTPDGGEAVLFPD